MSEIEKVQRIFMPGDKWLYYKIYSGPKTLESVLLNEIMPMAEKLKKENVIDKFFFIRYSDPDYHLRLRFHTESSQLQSNIIQSVAERLKQLVDQRLIWKVNIDCYNRELERYGNNTIDSIEELFHYNTNSVLSIIRHDESLQLAERWLWGIKYVDMLLDEFQLSINDKIQLFESLSNGFSSEFNLNKPLRLNLDKKLRKNQPQIDVFIRTKKVADSPLYKILLQSISESTTSINKILKISAENTLEVPFESLLNSIIHMHYNRLFRTQQRLYELVIYYSMHKYYKSLGARMKYNPSKVIVT